MRYNDFEKRGTRKSNKPSISLSEYAKDNNLNSISLAGLIKHDKLITKSFNVGDVPFYHITDLDSFILRNDKEIKTGTSKRTESRIESKRRIDYLNKII